MAARPGWHRGDVQPLLHPKHWSVAPLLGAGCEPQRSPLPTSAFNPAPGPAGQESESSRLMGIFLNNDVFSPSFLILFPSGTDHYFVKKLEKGKRLLCCCCRKFMDARGDLQGTVFIFLSDISTRSVSRWLVYHPYKSPREKPSREISNQELFYQVCVTNTGTESNVSFGPSETGVPGNQRAVLQNRPER